MHKIIKYILGAKGKSGSSFVKDSQTSKRLQYD